MTNFNESKRKRLPNEDSSNRINVDGEELSLSDGSESVGIDEEFVVDGDGEADDMIADEDNDLQIYLPGGELEKDEELVADHSAYEMLHSINPEWPCLSFDILKDGLGDCRTQFPMTASIVAGSQADSADKNRLYVMKMSNLCRTRKAAESSDSEDDEDYVDPSLIYKSIAHKGGVNRTRVYNSHVASWSDNGKVYIWDISETKSALDRATSAQRFITENAKPVHTVTCHEDEGFAMDWSPTDSFRLLTGDCHKQIYLTVASQGQSEFVTESTPFVGHSSSVEDIQWSPTERQVFSSCSSDGTIQIWDVRVKKASQLTIKASHVDMNVINWNRTVDYLMAGGDDAGTFQVWDLRSVAAKSVGDELATPAAKFQWHRDAITSIEWAPHEGSMLAVAGADDQVTIWDLSLEADKEALQVQSAGMDTLVQVPAQLLFVHQGQKHIKEVHWHSQLPGVLLSTSMSGFNVFKTINS